MRARGVGRLKLFEIHDEIERILEREIDPETGELTDEVERLLDQLTVDLEEKCLAIAAYAKGCRTEGDAVMDQARKLRRRAKVHLNQADRLLRYVEANVTPGHKMRNEHTRIRWRRSTRCVIDDPVQVPAALRRVVDEPSTEKVKAYLQSTRTEHDWAHLEEHQNMQVD